jgi:hypothetical protein
MALRYPLANLKPGESFFVAGLDLVGIRERGLLATLPYRYKMKVTFGIQNGLIGVRFLRLSGGGLRLKTSSSL